MFHGAALIYHSLFRGEVPDIVSISTFSIFPILLNQHYCSACQLQLVSIGYFGLSNIVAIGPHK
jgi:hypothetical protein